jgi:hypothetical protein
LLGISPRAFRPHAIASNSFSANSRITSGKIYLQKQAASLAELVNRAVDVDRPLTWLSLEVGAGVQHAYAFSMGRAWRTDELLPSTAALRLLSVSATEAGVSVEAEGQSSAPCPACGRLSRARHSRYWRTLKDLAVQGQAVTLRLHVSRWRCRQARCATQVFTERLPGVCVPHGRHTQRFAAIIHLVGYALGGRGGEQLLERLGMAVSDDTLLRVLNGAPPW